MDPTSSTHSWLPTEDIHDVGEHWMWVGILPEPSGPDKLKHSHWAHSDVSLSSRVRGRGCKTYSPGLALHRRAFITSCYTLSQQPAWVAPTPLRPRGVFVFAPQTHLFGTFLPLYSFDWGFVLPKNASVCCHWRSVTECFSPAQTSGWWTHF